MRRFVIFLFSLIVVLSVSAQHRHKSSHQFDFTARAGINLGQIDGDSDGNYSHIGFNVGVNTSFPISHSNPNLRMLVELGLTNKGSVVSAINRHISCTYFEVPILVTYSFGNIESQQLRVGAGIAPAFLGWASVTDWGNHNPLLEQNFRRMDRLPLCLDAQYRFNGHWGLDIRYTNSFLSIAKEAGSGTYRLFRSNKGIFNNILAASITYRF